jgi:hypothetical protein
LKFGYTNIWVIGTFSPWDKASNLFMLGLTSMFFPSTVELLSLLFLATLDGLGQQGFPEQCLATSGSEFASRGETCLTWLWFLTCLMMGLFFFVGCY